MLERGDVVIYEFHNPKQQTPMNGMIAIVLGPYMQDSVRVRLIQATKANPWVGPSKSSWQADPYFYLRNCRKIGHVDLDDLDAV